MTKPIDIARLQTLRTGLPPNAMTEVEVRVIPGPAARQVAAFLAAAMPAIPAMLDALEAATRERDEARARFHTAHEQGERLAAEIAALRVQHAAAIAEVARCVREERDAIDAHEQSCVVDDAIEEVDAEPSAADREHALERVVVAMNATDAALADAGAGERALREAEERGRAAERAVFGEARAELGRMAIREAEERGAKWGIEAAARECEDYESRRTPPTSDDMDSKVIAAKALRSNLYLLSPAEVVAARRGG